MSKEKIVFYREEPSIIKKAGFFLYGYTAVLSPYVVTGLFFDGYTPQIVVYSVLGSLLIWKKSREYVLMIHEVFRDRWFRFELSCKLSRTLRETLNNAKLTFKKDVIKRRKIEEKTVYPNVGILADDYNYYMTIRMLNGQTTNQWDGKLDAFSNALGCDLVHSQIDKGIVEMTLQHSRMNSNEVINKTDNEHSLTIGFSPGQELKWNFDESPHCLLVGLTGKGKSTFVRNLLKQFRDDWILRIVDGKFVEFTFLADMGYHVATKEDEFKSYVDDAQNEVNRRFRMLQEGRKNNYKQLGLKPYFLLCDEFIFLAESLNSSKAKGESQSEREKMFAQLRDISLRGRAAGVYLILILQRPDSTFMPTVIRDNLTCKIVLGGSETAFEMAFGSEHKKLANLPIGQGYCMINETVKNFSFPNYEMEEFISDLERKRVKRPTVRSIPSMGVVTIEPDPDIS